MYPKSEDSLLCKLTENCHYCQSKLSAILSYCSELFSMAVLHHSCQINSCMLLIITHKYITLTPTDSKHWVDSDRKTEQILPIWFSELSSTNFSWEIAFQVVDKYINLWLKHVFYNVPRFLFLNWENNVIRVLKSCENFHEFFPLFIAFYVMLWYKYYKNIKLIFTEE